MANKSLLNCQLIDFLAANSEASLENTRMLKYNLLACVRVCDKIEYAYDNMLNCIHLNLPGPVPVLGT